jgi:ATP-binding protein involved in chromosome partitioning
MNGNGMSSLTIEQVRASLSAVKDIVKGQDIIALGMVSGISIAEGNVVFAIEVDPARGKEMEPLRQAAQEAVEKLPGVKSVRAVLTAEKKAPPALTVKQPKQQVTHKISSRPVAPQVKYLIAVASGKGGVGKSTASVNLAAAFVALGLKTGLLDADIYGASQPRMTGFRAKPETNGDDMIIPPVVQGMKVMSMGFFVEPEAPIIWRGPMVHSAIQQLLRDVAWGELDVLVIDLPPGTGDAQLSIAQNVPLAGAVIISTPQDIALSEAKKGLAMFRKVNVPVLGLIENMSYHICSSCGHREHIFDHGGVRAEAARLGVEFLGEVPLHIDVRMASDAGQPLVTATPEHPISLAFMGIAGHILRRLERPAAQVI